MPTRLEEPRSEDIFIERKSNGHFVIGGCAIIDLPGLHLTFDQVRRLLAVDTTTCVSVLDSLVELRFLKRAANGTYARASDRRASVAPLLLEKQDSTQRS